MVLLEIIKKEEPIPCEEPFPYLDKDGKPIKVTQEQLDRLKIILGEPEELGIPPEYKEKLNIISNMVKGLSYEEAKAKYYKDIFENQIGSFLENAVCQVDSEDGPTPGTMNKGLNTLELPKELTEAANYDPNKIYVDRME